jgi:hypothetical protein
MYLTVFYCMFAVSLGCFHDDVRAEPGSWMVVGMIPVFDKKKATRGKGPTEDGPNGPATRRAEDGPNGAARRRISLTHQCLSALLEGWNALTENNKIIQWADGVWRRTRILLAGIFMDQPETDTYCCDTAQSCKLCQCPKHRLHEPLNHPPKHAHSVEAKVLRAADGLNPGTKPLFHRNGSFWKPTSHCSKAAYERGRKALNGTHIMHNALWGVRGFDVQQSVRFLYIYIDTNIYIGIC